MKQQFLITYIDSTMPNGSRDLDKLLQKGWMIKQHTIIVLPSQVHMGYFVLEYNVEKKQGN